MDYGNLTPDYFIGDPLRLRQILLNLLSNAIKFTHKGSITVSVQYQQHKNTAPVLDIKIIDTGIGISDEQKKQLFDAFTQADQATTRKYGGTGLGLSICKKLADLMKGNIEVHSKPNQGSTFLLKLNLSADEKYLNQSNPNELIPVSNNNNQDDSSISTDNPIKQNTILLVEDNLVNQKIALMMLKKLGLNVVLAKDGEDALKQWNEHHYLFIYMDCLMPNMDGYQATQAIRKQQQNNKVQPIIVALTANASQEDMDKCLASGMDDIVTKPFKKTDLISNINKWGEHLVSLKNTDPMENASN